MNRNRIIAGGIVGFVLVGLLAYGLFEGRKAVAQPAPDVQARPITDVACGQTYQFDHLERFYVNGRVVVNFYFGGKDRNLQPQYIVDRNVIGLSSEIREERRVVRSLAYSEVAFLCLSDPFLEGQRASNVNVMRYRLTLRRPLRHQKVIRQGGPARR